MVGFSIITPVLNMAGTIRDCIESVACQIDDVEAVQHIIVDGGSDDGTLDVISDYPHIELIHEPAPGIYVAMNRGIAAARHEVVGIVNADDLLEIGALGVVSGVLEANPRVQIVAGLAVVERLHDGDRKFVRIAPSRGHKSQSWDLLFHGSMPTNAYFFRLCVFKENGSFNVDFAVCSDRELLIRFKLAGILTLPVKRILYRYLAHEGSTTLNAERRHDVQMCNERIAIAESYLAKGQPSSSVVRRFREWIAAERARVMMARSRAGEWRLAWQEAQMGLKASTQGFLVFLLRRAVAIPTARARRWPATLSCACRKFFA
ncbi:glycosyltransferase [Pelagibius litoralis]|uniref:Glycosyltransferase n=1 Tax=Pelagibius litoralis TaxID=374515 RepID=A0A967EVT3_9PROT|nr:glycosyltransferase [Pelagibius litoralis]NIA69017.1 glycosyltransferase [Pelagibius litoralis]